MSFPTMNHQKHQLKKRWTWILLYQRSQNKEKRRLLLTVGAKAQLPRKKKETKRKVMINQTHNKKMARKRTASHHPNHDAATVGEKTAMKDKVQWTEDQSRSCILETWLIPQILPIYMNSSPFDMAEKVYWSVIFPQNVKLASPEDLDSSRSQTTLHDEFSMGASSNLMVEF